MRKGFNLFLIFLILFIMLKFSWADTSCTKTVANVSDLQNALTEAQENSKDDVICIQAGTYSITQTLNYYTSNGDSGHKLTLKSIGGQVILDGGSNVQILKIVTYDDSITNNSDEGGDITINGIIFQNGKSSSSGGAVYVRT